MNQVFRRFVLLGLVASLSAVAAHGETRSTPRGSEPEATWRVEPCCTSLPPTVEPTTRRVAYGEIEHSTPLPAGRLRELKERAYVATDLPPGRELAAEGGREGGPPNRGAAAGMRLRKSFDGLDVVTAGHEGFQLIPPDTIVAVSKKRVLEATNTGLFLANRSGRDATVLSLNAFFGELAPPLLFDPKVHFDRLSGRFFIVALSDSERPKRSTIHVAVSRSDDPRTLLAPDDWCSYRINAKRQNSAADYPSLGGNGRWLAVGVNNFRFSGGFQSPYLYVLEKESLVDNAGDCPAATVHRFKTTRDDRGHRAFTLQPAEHYTESDLPGAPLFLVSTRFATCDNYIVWRLEGEVGSKPRLSKATLDAGALYTFPPEAPQRSGTILHTGDQRAMQAAFRDGVLWTVHATGCEVGALPNESCVRVVGIRPTAAGQAVTFLDTFGQRGTFMWWPGLAVNRRGEVLAVFQRSREDEFMGASFVSRMAGAEVLGGLRTLRDGTCPLDNLSDRFEANRTGDYVGVQTDPKDNRSFWIAGEYPAEIPRQGCSWRTRIGRVR